MRRSLGIGTMGARLAIAVLLVGVLVGVPGAIAIRSSAREALRDEVVRRNAEFAASLADQLDGRISALGDSLKLVASRPGIVDLNPHTSELAVALRVLADVDEVVLFDRQGRAVAAAAARAQLDPDEVVSRPEMLSTLVGDEPPPAGLAVRVVMNGHPTLEVATTVEHPPGTVVGAMLARTPVDLVAHTVQARPLGPSAVAFLVDTNGRVLAHPERNRVVDAERYDVGALLESEDSSRVIGSGDSAVLASVAATRIFPGSVVVEQDEDEALGSASQRVGDLTVLLVLVVGMMLVVVVTVVSRLLSPLRGLARAVNRLARGDRTARAPGRGSVEVRAVAEEVNRMADALQERLAELEATQDELREAEERFRTAFRLAPVGMALSDLEGRYLQVNPALCELLQRREETLVGASWRELTHPDDRGMSEASLEEALRSGLQRYQIEKRYLRPDGTAVWVLLSVSVVRDRDRAPDHFIVHVQDVTPQRRAQEELARLFGQAADAEERLRRVIDASPDATLVVTGEGTVEFASRKTIEVFGYDPDELVGGPVERLLPDRFRDGHMVHRDRYIDAPAAREMGAGLELWGRRNDGSEFPVEVALSPMPTDEGPKVIAAVRDVTERRVAQAAARALHEARMRQRQAMEVNDTIVQGLTVARWSLEMGEEQRALEALERTLDSARGLIADMLLESSPEGLRPGDLVRQRPADLS